METFILHNKHKHKYIRKYIHEVVKGAVFYLHGLFKHFDLLAAFWRFSLEHVAVVGSGGGGVFRQRGVGAQL